MIPDDLNLILKAARILANLTQIELARKIGMSRGVIQRAENGDMNMSLRNFTAVMEALEQSGIEFIPEQDGKGMGIRRRAPTKSST